MSDIPRLTEIKSSSIKLTEYEGERIEWKDSKTCYISTAKQCSKLWKRLRIGSISMSLLSTCIGRTPFRVSKEESAKIICGLSDKSFDEKSLRRMDIGITGEPILRAWHSKNISKEIKETGVGVWKKDPRFRGSVDGDIDDGTFCEYKIPEYLYRQLIEHLEAIKKGFTPPPSYHKHIFDSHYDQMIGNGVIHGKHTCRYVVMSWKHSLVYQQDIPIDEDHWNNLLYPQACEFYDAYVEPLMIKHSIQRIDP